MGPLPCAEVPWEPWGILTLRVTQPQWSDTTLEIVHSFNVRSTYIPLDDVTSLGNWV